MALKFFAYSCHCSVDTELIDRKNNAINCINCVLICSEVKRQFSSPFALEITWTMESLHGKEALMIFGLLAGSPVRSVRRTQGRSPFHPSRYGPIRFPQHLFSVHDHGSNIEPSLRFSSRRGRLAGDPVDSDPGARLP